MIPRHSAYKFSQNPAPISEDSRNNSIIVDDNLAPWSGQKYGTS